MAKIVTVNSSDLRTVMRELTSAHEAITEGIATHAEKHRAKLEAARHAAEQTAQINEGIKRQSASIPPGKPASSHE